MSAQGADPPEPIESSVATPGRSDSSPRLNRRNRIRRPALRAGVDTPLDRIGALHAQAFAPASEHNRAPPRQAHQHDRSGHNQHIEHHADRLGHQRDAAWEPNRAVGSLRLDSARPCRRMVNAAMIFDGPSQALERSATSSNSKIDRIRDRARRIHCWLLSRNVKERKPRPGSLKSACVFTVIPAQRTWHFRSIERLVPKIGEPICNRRPHSTGHRQRNNQNERNNRDPGPPDARSHEMEETGSHESSLHRQSTRKIRWPAHAVRQFAVRRVLHHKRIEVFQPDRLLCIERFRRLGPDS